MPAPKPSSKAYTLSSVCSRAIITKIDSSREVPETVSRDTCAPLRCIRKIIGRKITLPVALQIDKVSFGGKEFLYKWGIIEKRSHRQPGKGGGEGRQALNRNARKCV